MTAPAKKQIPQFKNLQEEAEFWDTHDFTEYKQGFKPVRAKFAKQLSQVVSVRLDEKTMKVLRGHARRKGIGSTTLIRMWVLERLHEKTAATL